MPEISVVLPFFNAEHTLNEAIKSIADQSYSCFECLLVNNNSTDQSRCIAKSWVQSDSRFKLVDEQRQGVTFATNLGSSMAKARYIARMDADDVALPDRLSLQYDFLERNPDYGAVAGLAAFGGDSSKAAGINRFVDWNNSIRSYRDILRNRFVESPIINPTAMWRKKTETWAGSFEHGDFPEDYELWLRWLEKGVKIAKVPEIVLQWNDPQQRLTRKDERYSFDAFYRIKAKYLNLWLQKHNPHYPEIYVWGASRRIRKRAQMLEQYNVEIKAYIDINLRRKIDKPLIHYEHLPDPDISFILVYMPHHDIKTEIKAHLEANGYIEGVNYLLAA